MNTEAKFSIGDKVKIVNYGHLLWSKKNNEYQTGMPLFREDGDVNWHDASSHLIGKVGVISEVTETQGKHQYAIEGVPEKTAWYSNEQLELVQSNTN